MGLVAFVGVAIGGWLWATSNDKFDRWEWLAHRGHHCPDNPRWGMRRDVRRNHLPKGKTREWVIEELGEPDHSKSPTIFSYQMGRHLGLGFGEESLDVDFDSTGRLSGSKIVKH
jgi:hypothetical protein